MPAAPAPTGLVVPVGVAAFCVGTTDPQRTGSFAGATVDYSSLTTQNPQAFLGGSATRPLSNDALIPVEPGVHLHWALPDALTKAVNQGSALQFPAAPNRWLVTRLVLAGDNFTSQSFVIESDRLNQSAPSTTAMVIPVKPLSAPSSDGGTSLPDFDFLGQSWPLASYPGTGPTRALKEATGFELTAVSNGVPSFGAYYPESRNSFGFWDQLSDLPDQAQLAYVVTGWYQDGANDPARIAAGAQGESGIRDALSESHKWHVDPGPDPAFTLYSGFISGIAWNEATAYVPATPAPIIARTALGNTPSEALAAYFVQALDLGSVDAEQLLTAFQQGLWPRFTQPTANLLARVLERLHDSQFRRIEAGIVYAVYQAANGKTAEAITLPAGISDGLNTLNAAAAELIAARNAVEAFRWRVFADWYRYFLSADSAVVFTHLTQTLAPLWSGTAGIQARLQNALAARDAALKALTQALTSRTDLSIRELPAARYHQPNEPVLLLNADELATPSRYGGDGDHRDDGKLACRSTADIISAVTVNGTARHAGAHAAVAHLGSVPLPNLGILSALIAEACLLNCDSAAVWSGASVAALLTGLDAVLAGNADQNNLWQITAGKPPSPIEVARWDANPWLPIFLAWDAGFAPIADTGGGLQPYAPGFFTTNFSVDPTVGSFVAYSAPSAIDPSKADYTAHYAGFTFLSQRAAVNFAAQIEALPQKDRDPTLTTILSDLQQGGFLVQGLAGFDAALLNQTAPVQVSVVVPPHASPTVQMMTQFAQGVLDNGQQPITWDVMPEFNSPYNPIRAGFLNVAAPAFNLVAVDAFGQRRPIQFPAPGPNGWIPAIAASMAATAPGGGSVEPGFAYAAPRIAQPARLEFEWISAADGNVRLIDDHSASTPICGWLLPNHLTLGLGFYNAAGRPLGSLFVGGDDSSTAATIVWQGAPGSDADIDQTIDQDVVLAAADPRMRSLALQLGLQTSIADFQAFYTAVDTAYASIDPGDAPSDAGVAVLIGRPVAVVQASLRLDLKGPPSLSQNTACLSSQGWTDTDGGLSGITFPVALGDLDRLDDGLVGFFAQASGGGYDLTTFYSQASTASSNVVPPTPETLLLTPTPALPDQAGHGPYKEQRILMLVDPRAPVHAITGILPTQTLVVPPDRAAAAISTLEFSVAVTPTLRASGGLALPLPVEPGFEAAFLERRMGSSGPLWVTLPDITPSVANAIWSYTPQTLTEGWLRFNPSVVTATLVNASGQPIAQGGQTQTMTLQLVNRAPIAITFSPGAIVPESQEPAGSIFYIHLGRLVDDPDWSNISCTAPGWVFTLYFDNVYGHYIAATCLAPVTLLPYGSSDSIQSAAELDITLGGLKASADVAQAHISVDYYAVDGISDGVAGNIVTINQAHHAFTPGRSP